MPVRDKFDRELQTGQEVWCPGWGLGTLVEFVSVGWGEIGVKVSWYEHNRISRFRATDLIGAGDEQLSQERKALNYGDKVGYHNSGRGPGFYLIATGATTCLVEFLDPHNGSIFDYYVPARRLYHL